MPSTVSHLKVTASSSPFSFSEPQTGGDAVERRVRCLRCLLFPEKPPSDRFIEWKVGPTPGMVGPPAGVLGY